LFNLLLYIAGINICLGNTSLCGENAECYSMEENYTCTCMEGYEGDPYYVCEGTLF